MKGTNRYLRGITAYLFITCLLSALLTASGALAAVNVYLAPGVSPTLQDQFIDDTKTQYIVTITTPMFFQANRNITLLKRNNVIPQPPVVDPKLITLDSITNKMVDISSHSFEETYGLGMYYERQTDLNIISGLIGICPDQSCKDALQGSYDAIFLQDGN